MKKLIIKSSQKHNELNNH